MPDESAEAGVEVISVYQLLLLLHYGHDAIAVPIEKVVLLRFGVVCQLRQRVRICTVLADPFGPAAHVWLGVVGIIYADYVQVFVEEAVVLEGLCANSVCEVQTNLLFLPKLASICRYLLHCQLKTLLYTRKEASDHVFGQLFALQLPPVQVLAFIILNLLRENTSGVLLSPS